MCFQKVQLRRRGGLFQQRAQVAQAPGAMMQGFLGSTFQRGDRMFAGQRQQAVQDPDADGTALLHHRLGPTAGVHADQPCAIQQIIQTLLNDAPVRGMQMVRVGGELARFGQRMDGDDFPALVEHPHQPGLPAHPDLPPDILRRHRVIRPLQLDVTIPMHRARGFFKHRKQTRRQRQQFGAFHFVEHLADLLPGGAVNARVGHAAFPIRKNRFCAARLVKLRPLSALFWAYLTPASILPLWCGMAGLRRQHHRAVVPAKLLHLRVEFGIIPVRPRHGGPQVINDQRAGNPAEVTERIFQTPDEALGRLLPDHFTVAFARMAQDNPKQMRSLPLAVHHHPRALAKIHLGFGSRLHLHPHKRHRLGLPQLPHEPFDGLITAGETVVAHQVLINPLGAQPDRHRRFNLRCNAAGKDSADRQ